MTPSILDLLLDPDPALDADALLARVDAALTALGCEPPAPGSDPEAPEIALHFLARMAWRTLRRAKEPLPAIDPDTLARFEAALVHRPARDEAHGQLFIDAPSALRRAGAILEHTKGPILAVGDDDAVSLALVLLGAGEVTAVDIDERILDFLSRAGANEGCSISTQRVDVLNEPVPEPLRRRFAAVVTDPFRDLDGGVGFVLYAAACMERDAPSALFWVDHPDWNFEHDRVRADLEAVGLELDWTREDLHAYPLSLAVFDPSPIAEAFALPIEGLRALVEKTSAWSHLHRLRRTRG